VGSALRADDAAGLLAAEEFGRILKERPHLVRAPRAVEIFFGETSPENLTGQIKAFRPTALVVLDAVSCGADPGHLLLIRPDQIPAGSAPSTHNGSLRLLLDYLSHSLQAEVIVLGIQTQTLEFGQPPSAAVTQAARSAAALLARLFLRTGASARERAASDLARTAKQATLSTSSMQPDAVQIGRKPLEARPSSQTEPTALE
jgi:hydrogenase maturation protease